MDEGWINGGFFVVEPEFLKFIGNKNVMLERSPLLQAVKTKNLSDGYKKVIEELSNKIVDHLRIIAELEKEIERLVAENKK